MADPVRGITCADMRRVIREALRGGWRFDGFTGTTHARIVWPATGTIVTFGTTPSVASWKTTATEILRASGVEVWRKGNRRRSRKPVDRSGFAVDSARADNARWHATFDGTVEDMQARRDHLVEQCRTLTRRERLHELPPLLREIADIERRIADDFHQPIERFDPYTLRGDIA